MEFVYRFLAAAVLGTHFTMIAFILGSPMVVAAGYFRRWAWVRNPYLRNLHNWLLMLVAVEAIMAWPCPLTVWENYFRAKGGMPEYGPLGCVDHWMNRLFGVPVDFTAFNLIFLGVFALSAWLYIVAPPYAHRPLLRLRTLRQPLSGCAGAFSRTRRVAPREI